jgi:hypothetical protein
MKLSFMCSCRNLPKSPFLQSHLELSSLRLSAFGTTILLCFQICIKKNELVVKHELNKSWNSFEYKSIYETLFDKKDVICKLLHAHVEYKNFLGRYFTTSPYEVVKNIAHKGKTKNDSIWMKLSLIFQSSHCQDICNETHLGYM